MHENMDPRGHSGPTSERYPIVAHFCNILTFFHFFVFFLDLGYHVATHIRYILLSPHDCETSSGTDTDQTTCINIIFRLAHCTVHTEVGPL